VRTTKPEPDLQPHLGVGDRPVLVELAPDLGDLEPIEVPERLAGALERVADRVVDRAGGRPDDLADRVDMVSHPTSSVQ